MGFQRPDIKVIASKDRQDALISTLTLTSEKLQTISKRFEDIFLKGFQASNEVDWLQTCINQLPTSKEIGDFYSLTISENEVCACHVELLKKEISLKEVVRRNYTIDGFRISLTESKMSASVLLTSSCEAVHELLNQDRRTNQITNFVVTSSYPIDVPSLSSAFLHKFYEIGKCDTDDPLVGTDIVSLLNIGMERRGIPAKFIGALSDTTALLLAASYERPDSTARCLMSIDVGSSIRSAFVQPNPSDFGFKSAIIDVDVSRFNGSKKGCSKTNFSTQLALPFCSIDFEVDFAANPSTVGLKSLERMVAAKYLPEICRRLIVNAFQCATPSQVWADNSLSFRNVLVIVSDDAQCEKTKDVLLRVWDWSATKEEAAIVHRLVNAAFSRSAGLTAVTIATIAKRTGRLQPALGGVFVGMGGVLGLNKSYQTLLRSHLDAIFQRDTKSLIYFLDVEEAPAKGAAILSCMIHNKSF